MAVSGMAVLSTMYVQEVTLNSGQANSQAMSLEINGRPFACGRQGGPSSEYGSTRSSQTLVVVCQKSEAPYRAKIVPSSVGELFESNRYLKALTLSYATWKALAKPSAAARKRDRGTQQNGASQKHHPRRTHFEPSGTKTEEA